MLTRDVDDHPSQQPVESHDWALHRLRDMERRHVRRSVAAALGRATAAAALLLTAYALMPLAVLSGSGLVMRIVIAFAVIGGATWWEIRAVGRAEIPQLRAVEALAVTVTVIVVSFAACYLNLSQHDPAAFNEELGRISALYFTMTTIATIGYGDIHPVSEQARVGVMIQIVANVVVLGAAVRLIIAMARHRVLSTRRDAA
jgi:voltage-gated potassium channel